MKKSEKKFLEKIINKYSKKEEKWIRSKYISKGCNSNWRNHIN